MTNLKREPKSQPSVLPTLPSCWWDPDRKIESTEAMRVQVMCSGFEIKLRLAGTWALSSMQGSTSRTSLIVRQLVFAALILLDMTDVVRARRFSDCAWWCQKKKRKPTQTALRTLTCRTHHTMSPFNRWSQHSVTEVWKCIFTTYIHFHALNCDITNCEWWNGFGGTCISVCLSKNKQRGRFA